MKNVLILGCGRSGTSIFGELFKHLEPYQYFSEPSFNLLLDWDYSQPLAVKVPREEAAFPPDKGLSFPLDTLLDYFKTPQIYWQVRHPLDAICSLKVGISKNWGHHPQPHDWKEWLGEPLIKQCAYHWNYINTFGYERVKDFVKISKFETMLEDPFAFGLNICKELELQEKDYKKSIITWASRVQDTNNQNFVEAETSRPYSTNDHKVKVGRWQENMTQEEYDLVVPMIKSTAAKFGYNLS